MIKVHSIVPHSYQEVEHERLLRFSPGGRGRWRDLEYTRELEEADLYTVFWPTDRNVRDCPPKSVINLTREPSFHKDFMGVRKYGYPTPPPEFFGAETLFSRWVKDGPISAVWWINKSYDDLKGTPFPKKDKLASCIITGKTGRPGQRLRLKFLKRFAEEHPGVLDVYGRNKGDFDLNQILGYKGPVEDKWEVLAPYRYAIALENNSQPNFWGEQLNDAFLAGCFPLYFGCTNLEEFLPQKSFYWLDITDPEAPDRASNIFESDLRENRLPELYDAKNRILSRYQYWPMLHGIIGELIYQGKLDLGKLEQSRNRYQYS